MRSAAGPWSVTSIGSSPVVRSLPVTSLHCTMNEMGTPARLPWRSPGPKQMHFLADVFA